MTLKALFQERPRHFSSLVHQQLRFYAMDAGGLLQSFDDVYQQSRLDFKLMRIATFMIDEQIPDYALISFVDEKRIPEQASTLQRGVARQDLRVNIAQDHIGRPCVIPGEQP